MARTGYDERVLTWDDIEQLVGRLTDQLAEKQFDLFLGIARGGLPLTGILAKRLRHFPVVTVSIMRYDERDIPLKQPILLESPAEVVFLNRRVLIVDDVWDEGYTTDMVKKIVSRAGGIPEVAVLHYKPQRSKVEGRPEYAAEETNEWIRYPWEPYPDAP